MRPINRAVSTPHAAIDESKVHSQPFRQCTLGNGMNVFFGQVPRSDIIHLTLGFKAGYLGEDSPATAAGVVRIIESELTREGSVDVNCLCQESFAKFQFFFAGHQWSKVLPRIREMVFFANFSEEGLDAFRADCKWLRTDEENDDVAHLDRVLSTIWYGPDHPYLDTCETGYEEVTVDGLETFHKERYWEKGATIFVSGNVGDDGMQDLEEVFGTLALHDPRPRAPAKSSMFEGEAEFFRCHVDRYQNKGERADLLFKTVHRLGSDGVDVLWKLRFLSFIFGEGLDCRLTTLAKEFKYLAHGHSTVREFDQVAEWVIRTSAAMGSCDAARDLIRRALRQLCEVRMTVEELDRYRYAFLEQRVYRCYDLPEQLRLWEDAMLEGHRSDFFSVGAEVLRDLTPEGLRAVAEKYLKPELFRVGTLS